MRAAAEGRANCVRLLIDAGADKNAKNSVRDILCIAVVPSFCFYGRCFCIAFTFILIFFISNLPLGAHSSLVSMYSSIDLPFMYLLLHQFFCPGIFQQVISSDNSRYISLRYLFCSFQ
jgi:hypothetical protein